ncbi:CocE/NonD family hydrolase [Nocardia miyunensis]|uniref:CocE/NonD family hydrolase n=1 Tax=Nocardia miyunensis TaxID=282684 RepID=UPI00082DAF34|nr:CocE/NonD family hydrolase [Nocardia miyunensis]
MATENDIYIPMRDGIHISADVYRPDSVTRGPVVLIRTPYVKNLSVSPANTGSWTTLGADGRPRSVMRGMVAATGQLMERSIPALVEAGYTVVVSDSRGTGYAEGTYDYYNIEGGPLDGFDTVEWIAEQPWCDGNVGMWGVSGSAILAHAAALTSPPHLKAIAAYMCPADFYLDQWFPGGMCRYEDRVRWPMLMQDCIAPLDPGSADGPGYERKRLIFEQRYYRYYDRMTRGQSPVPLDWAAEALSHDRYDEFWQARSFDRRLAGVTAPVLNVGVLHDHFIRGTMRFHEGLTVPRRMLLVPGALDLDASAGDGGLAALQIRWFDYFLRGTENGVLDDPAVRYYLTGARQWTDQPEWPAVSEPTPLFLTAAGGLAWEPTGQGDSLLLSHDPAAPSRTPGDAGDQRSFGPGALTFTTPPLARDLTVVGQPRLALSAAPGATDVDFCVRLSDAFPDGSAHLLNVGALKGRHVHSHEHPADLEPGQAYQFDIEILTVTNVFRRGHRIRVDVSGGDFPFYAPNPVKSQTDIFCGGDDSSRLILPIAGN